MDNTIDQKLVEEIEARYLEDLRKNGLTVETVLDFPKYRQWPDYLVLAASVIENDGGKFIKRFSRIEAKNENKV